MAPCYKEDWAEFCFGSLIKLNYISPWWKPCCSWTQPLWCNFQYEMLWCVKWLLSFQTLFSVEPFCDSCSRASNHPDTTKKWSHRFLTLLCHWTSEHFLQKLSDWGKKQSVIKKILKWTRVFSPLTIPFNHKAWVTTGRHEMYEFNFFLYGKSWRGKSCLEHIFISGGTVCVVRHVSD